MRLWILHLPARVGLACTSSDIYIIRTLPPLKHFSSMGKSVFTLDVFIICFRESLEAAIIISVLLSFIKQCFDTPETKRTYKKLKWQVWIGALLGLFICLAIGGGFIGAFYGLGKDIWSGAEDLWEGIFSVIACIMITAMGIPMLKINKMQEKWKIKISRALLDDEELHGGKPSLLKKIKNLNPLNFRPKKLGAWGRRNAMALLPFITTLREGIEAIVFVGGVGIGKPATAFPLSVVLGLLCGLAFGYAVYKLGALMALKYFLIFSTCLLYLISAGLFSRAIWYFQMYVFSKKTGGDVAESGNGPGSYDISETVWHVNCCSPETNDNGWGIFNALFGWQNTATYGSVISYNCYWIFIMALVLCLIYEEKTGKLPLIGRFWQRKEVSQDEAEDLYRRAQARARALENGDNIIENHDSIDDSLSGSEKKNTKPATTEV